MEQLNQTKRTLVIRKTDGIKRSLEFSKASAIVWSDASVRPPAPETLLAPLSAEVVSLLSSLLLQNPTPVYGYYNPENKSPGQYYPLAADPSKYKCCNHIFDEPDAAKIAAKKAVHIIPVPVHECTSEMLIICCHCKKIEYKCRLNPKFCGSCYYSDEINLV